MRSIPVGAGSIRPRREDPKTVLARLWLDVEAARRALARGRHPAIAHTARGLLASLCDVRIRFELEHAAAAFAEGLDERPEAEEWVFFAVAARATLDQAEKCGAGILRHELEDIDDIYEGSREAVLLLEPEDYKEALAATPPNTRAWWGERARLDEGLREIDLERALDEISENENAKRLTLRPPPPPDQAG